MPMHTYEPMKYISVWNEITQIDYVYYITVIGWYVYIYIYIYMTTIVISLFGLAPIILTHICHDNFTGTVWMSHLLQCQGRKPDEQANEYPEYIRSSLYNHNTYRPYFTGCSVMKIFTLLCTSCLSTSVMWCVYLGCCSQRLKGQTSKVYHMYLKWNSVRLLCGRLTWYATTHRFKGSMFVLRKAPTVNGSCIRGTHSLHQRQVII